jgi:hypothetical protein
MSKVTNRRFPFSPKAITQHPGTKPPTCAAALLKKTAPDALEILKSKPSYSIAREPTAPAFSVILRFSGLVNVSGHPSPPEHGVHSQAGAASRRPAHSPWSGAWPGLNSDKRESEPQCRLVIPVSLHGGSPKRPPGAADRPIPSEDSYLGELRMWRRTRRHQ